MLCYSKSAPVCFSPSLSKTTFVFAWPKTGAFFFHQAGTGGWGRGDGAGGKAASPHSYAGTISPVQSTRRSRPLLALTESLRARSAQRLVFSLILLPVYERDGQLCSPTSSPPATNRPNLRHVNIMPLCHPASCGTPSLASNPIRALGTSPWLHANRHDPASPANHAGPECGALGQRGQ